MVDVFDFEASRDVADRLVLKFGRTASLRRVTNGGTLPYAPTQSTADYATKAVRVEFSFIQRQGGDVRVTDERWLVAAGPLTALGITDILPQDALFVGGIARPILRATPLNPAGTVVVYDCQIRM